MFSPVALVSLAIVALSSASPLNIRQATSGPCAGLGIGAYDNVSNFTLGAYNLTLSNANATGAPLVLAFKQFTGSATGAYYSTLSTYYSVHSNDEPMLSLVNGSLLPSNPAEPNIYSSNLAVSSGNELLFEFSTEESELPTPAQNYCIVDHFDPAGKGPYSMLALNGITDGFSLCENDIPYDYGNPYDVVLEATEDNGHIYNYTTCYPVCLQVLYGL
ncbi:hypothetical protein SCP_0706020 [Sparassis crispa]|uniref:Ubiquitin 3 binding protein But2 C-terminal domain-containing protein n=1 Tax=Sparassis crispa TaxID=139825 RepID=A0A401GT64_9APHY|nr:hypothetical protein SCP_0706020 [Sparassis crispa]GBE85415.1 hypothetical protein SCP_0706020 [Sparassis crispa]